MSALTRTKKIKGVADAARLMGVNEKELVERAVLLYLESVKAAVDLEKELREWDALSDEAFTRMSKSLKSGL